MTHEVYPITTRRSVLQDWVHGLTFMQQSVLIAAVRGPDGIKKDHPVKVLCRYLRRCFLISAFDRTTIWDPYHTGGGSFTGPCYSPEVASLKHAVELYFRSVDELPHHFQLHLMHAAEILGYKHPETEEVVDTAMVKVVGAREFWHDFYVKCCADMHVHPETEQEMDKRLGDNEDNWRARETVTAL